MRKVLLVLVIDVLNRRNRRIRLFWLLIWFWSWKTWRRYRSSVLVRDRLLHGRRSRWKCWSCWSWSLVLILLGYHKLWREIEIKLKENSKLCKRKTIILVLFLKIRTDRLLYYSYLFTSLLLKTKYLVFLKINLYFILSKLLNS